MFVIKRDGSRVPMRYDSITDRNLEVGKDLNVDVAYLSQLVINGLKSGMTTSQIDDLSSETAFYLSCYNPDYDVLATRIAISDLHKRTQASFVEVVRALANQVNKETGKPVSVISQEFLEFVEANADALQKMLDFSRDWNYNYFGLKTMKRLYLLKVGDQVVERPQHMILRVAVSIHLTTDPLKYTQALQAIKETYDSMSSLEFTHASPTLFNAGSKTGNLSSCFLLHMDDDMHHIFETIQRCALISKHGGGIGIDISSLRAKGSVIHSNNGKSDGIVPMTQVLNATARYANQSSRRAGSFALYLEPSHPDIMEFLALRLPTPPDELRARDVFLALWVSDLFMKRVENDELWSLFCPAKVPELYKTYGEEYETLYLKAEADKRYDRQIHARVVWEAVCKSQQETGLPYMLYKDSINRKSNQKNIGNIKSSNLCVEGNTRILTSKGQIPINQLVNKRVDVWNGEEWSSVHVSKTNSNAEIIEVKMNNMMSILCTPYHKFPVPAENDQGFTLVEAKDLEPGTILYRHSKLPIVEGSKDNDNVTFTKTSTVPNSNCSQHLKSVWLRNILRTKAHVSKSGLAHFICYELSYAIRCRLTMQSMGMECNIIKVATKNERLPDSYYVVFYLNTHYHQKPDNLVTDSGIPFTFDNIVEEVNLFPKLHDTYCFTEPKRGLGMFNGVLLGNCAEIVEYTDKESVAVCNLASVALQRFVNKDGTYNYNDLQRVIRMMVRNLNKVIDRTHYPVEEGKSNNLLYRPIGIGIQGLADVFAMMKLAWTDEKAVLLNRLIAEVIYFAALDESCKLAAIDGPYSASNGSPASQGILQYDMWNDLPLTEPKLRHCSVLHGRSASLNEAVTKYESLIPDLNWVDLKQRIQEHGLRNSLLIALMPTASSSQILQSNECFEPFTSNIYSRSTNSGEFLIVNKHLYRDLNEIGLWNKSIVDTIIASNGSIQGIDNIPVDIKERYKTVWELSQKVIIQMAADRAPFIDQTQSMNLFVERPTLANLTSMHFMAWKKGLKTGSYYIRSRPARDAVKFTVQPKKEERKFMCVGNDGSCESCSA